MAGYTYALGRRKSATARVRLKNGKGAVIINGKNAEDYVSGSKYLIKLLQEPFTVIEQNNQYDVSALVSGGGLSGQIDAIRLGIAKALAISNEDLKASLK